MLAILTTHPIQYQVPLWRALADDGRVPFRVWYMTTHGIQPSHDREFGKTFAWDIDTLTGYPYELLHTGSSAQPSSFWKCRLRAPLKKRLHSAGVTALWIHGWQVAAYWQAIWQAQAAGIPIWLRGESNDLAPRHWWHRTARNSQLFWLFRRVDRFFYIGSANRELYRKFRVPEALLYPAPYAVDNERFERQAADLRARRQELRRAWGIAETAFCILFCGKFIPKKRPMDLVRAATLLHSNLPTTNPHLLFVGSGHLAPELRNACCVVFDEDAPHQPPRRAEADAASHPPRPLASFAGFMNQKEISKAYVAADCLVLPSDYGETWGLVVNEALASGLPCLVSNACGCAKDLVGESGSFEMGNIPMLAERLAELAKGAVKTAHLPSISQTVESVVRAYRDMT